MVISGKVKFPSDRLYKNGERRKVVFSTPQGDVIVWDDAAKLDPSVIRKGMAAQVEVTGTDNRGNQTGQIVAIGSNGINPGTPVNGNQVQAPYPPQAPPATGYPQQGPPVTPPVTGHRTEPVDLSGKIKYHTEAYLSIWSELTTNDKFPFESSEETIRSAVATIFIQVMRG